MSNLFDDDISYDDEVSGDDAYVPAHAHDSFAGDKGADAPAVPIFGVAQIEARLLHFINENKMPHGLIFTGPRGVGKKTVALRLARTLLAHGDKPVDEGPGLFGDAPPAVTKLLNLDVPADHPAARLIESGAHPDFLMIGGEHQEGASKSGAILVDDVRRVPAFLRLRPSSDNGWRVVIIDNADSMNRNAQNALLKILEEPPTRTLLILVAHSMGPILPTIRSRTQDVHFTALNDGDFRLWMNAQGYYVPEEDRKWIAALAGGCPGQVAKIIDADGTALIRDFLALWSGWPQVNEEAWMSFTESVCASASDDTAFRFIAYFWEWLATRMMRARIDSDIRTALHALAPLPELDAMIDRFTLAEWIDICDNLKSHFGRTLAAALEKRQALYSARMWMTSGFIQE